MPRGTSQGERRSKGDLLLRVLHVGRQLDPTLDTASLLGRVLDAALEMVSGQRGIAVVRRDRSVRIESARNVARAVAPETLSRILDEGDEVDVAEGADLELAGASAGARSTIRVPWSDGRRVGALVLESSLSPERIDAELKGVLRVLGEQAGWALRNAAAFQDAMARARDAERAKRSIEDVAEERRRLLDRRTDELLRARSVLAEARSRLEGSASRLGMVGKSAAMDRVFQAVDRVAPVDLPVLIEGESGTGKEMVARAVHASSPRHAGPMVAINCAAVPEGLLESELFGHTRGAFTGADRDRDGLFVAAKHGTLFLDEIGDMPGRMQADLLRVLQESKVRPVGGDRDIEIDVRVVAASQTPLARLVEKGRFREDLFYRMNVVTIRVPPLRERIEDLPLLVDHFLEAVAARTGTKRKTLSAAAVRRLRAHDWPGNVRQLEHVLMNAHVLCDGDVIDAEDLAVEGPGSRQAPAAPPTSAARHRGIERRRILEALEACGWNRSRACEKLGMPRRTFYRRLRAYRIL